MEAQQDPNLYIYSVDSLLSTSALRYITIMDLVLSEVDSSIVMLILAFIEKICLVTLDFI